jgi:chitosanase
LNHSGDTPEVIGEASILMAQTCFPNEGLDGGKGHAPIDVLCKLLATLRFIHLLKKIVLAIDVLFGNQVPSGVGDMTIDIAALKTLGDEQATKLAQALGV